MNGMNSSNIQFLTVLNKKEMNMKIDETLAVKANNKTAQKFDQF